MCSFRDANTQVLKRLMRDGRVDQGVRFSPVSWADTASSRLSVRSQINVTSKSREIKYTLVSTVAKLSHLAQTTCQTVWKGSLQDILEATVGLYLLIGVNRVNRVANLLERMLQSFWPEGCI